MIYICNDKMEGLVTSGRKFKWPIFAGMKYLFKPFFSIFDGNTKSKKKFKKNKIVSHLLKSVNNKHALFERVSR